MEKQEQKEIYKEFKSAVNMTAASLEKWLKTEESKKVGWDSGDGESIGHKSGEHIVSILRKKKAELTEMDYKHMQKVHGYVARHMAQKPEHPKDSNWDFSLKNWGHDHSKA
jgi:ribosomal protein L11